jgi:hypothetical protein
MALDDQPKKKGAVSKFQSRCMAVSFSAPFELAFLLLI